MFYKYVFWNNLLLKKSLLLTKAALVWYKCFCINYLKCHLFSMIKAEFKHITSVFSVTWSFRTHSNIQIYMNILGLGVVGFEGIKVGSKVAQWPYPKYQNSKYVISISTITYSTVTVIQIDQNTAKRLPTSGPSFIQLNIYTVLSQVEC